MEIRIRNILSILYFSTRLYDITDSPKHTWKAGIYLHSVTDRIIVDVYKIQCYNVLILDNFCAIYNSYICTKKISCKSHTSSSFSTFFKKFFALNYIDFRTCHTSIFQFLFFFSFFLLEKK